MVRLADSAAARSGLWMSVKTGSCFGEGSEVFGSVVSGDLVLGGLVEADADVSVGFAVGVFDLVFG